jgi:hypothetical protein
MPRWLLDALLQLAPAHIQVMAAITERWFAAPPGPKAAGAEATAPPAPVGGMVDSCYVWRSGGPLAAGRAALTARRRNED